MVETRQDKNKDLELDLRKKEINDKRKKVVKKVLKVFGIIFCIIIGFLLYMHYIGTAGLIVKEYKVSSKKLPTEMHGLKIVHFSDLNYFCL